MYSYMLIPQNFPRLPYKRYLKNVMSDCANNVTAEIGTSDNLTDEF